MRNPPKKQKGQAKGRRTIKGGLLGIPEAADVLGVTEKMLRNRVDRRLVPFRRWGSRIVFRKNDLDEWWEALPGCSIAEALENDSQRRNK